jgi:hypothetical protein
MLLLAKEARVNYCYPVEAGGGAFRCQLLLVMLLVNSMFASSASWSPGCHLTCVVHPAAALHTLLLPGDEFNSHVQHCKGTVYHAC